MKGNFFLVGYQIGLHGICVLDMRVRYDILSDLDRNVLSELLKPFFLFLIFSVFRFTSRELDRCLAIVRERSDLVKRAVRFSG